MSPVADQLDHGRARSCGPTGVSRRPSARVPPLWSPHRTDDRRGPSFSPQGRQCHHSGSPSAVDPDCGQSLAVSPAGGPRAHGRGRIGAGRTASRRGSSPVPHFWSRRRTAARRGPSSSPLRGRQCRRGWWPSAVGHDCEQSHAAFPVGDPLGLGWGPTDSVGRTSVSRRQSAARAPALPSCRRTAARKGQASTRPLSRWQPAAACHGLRDGQP
mmetsp:Transcript_64860/g.115386  ORF Transcript_64860/g.115386 Transcript_64860/m.115386 type:complete len:214 (-) Transcript_64860:453-1094(-)